MMLRTPGGSWTSWAMAPSSKQVLDKEGNEAAVSQPSSREIYCAFQLSAQESAVSCQCSGSSPLDHGPSARSPGCNGTKVDQLEWQRHCNEDWQ